MLNSSNLQQRLAASSAFGAILAAACLLVAGCGSTSHQKEVARVSGKVTLDGKPLPWGTVVFIPKVGRAAEGNIQPDGTYTLTTYSQGDGAQVGEHAVTIIHTDQKPGQPADPLNPRTPKWLIPQRYGQRDKSGLSFVVEPGAKNQADFTLSSR